MKFNYHFEYQRYHEYIRKQILEGLTKPANVISLALVSTIFFTSFLAIFALRPTLVTIGSLVHEIQDEKSTIQALENKITSLKAVQEIMTRIESRLYILANAIPKTPSLETFVKQIEIIAAKNQIASLEFTESNVTLKNPPSPLVRQSGLVSIPVTIIVSGNESSIRAFISDLESLERITVIKSILLSAITAENREKQSFPLTATINLDIYFQKY